MKNLYLKTVAALAALTVGSAAFATDPYAAISSAASWTNVGTDGVLIAVGLAGIYVIFRGAKMLVGFIRR